MNSELEYRDEIYARANNVDDFDALKRFMEEIMAYPHDYGTIVHGLMAAMKASFSVVNKSPRGGISGFQASFLGWECVREFMGVKGAAKLLDYENMLYPQYADKFEKKITRKIWESLKDKARENLNKPSPKSEAVLAHWQSIADGTIPFGFLVVEEE